MIQPGSDFTDLRDAVTVVDDDVAAIPDTRVAISVNKATHTR